MLPRSPWLRANGRLELGVGENRVEWLGAWRSRTVSILFQFCPFNIWASLPSKAGQPPTGPESGDWRRRAVSLP
ncbi:hypothetical protein GCM10020219_028930 [Nonomuraea dietziae]